MKNECPELDTVEEYDTFRALALAIVRQADVDYRVLGEKLDDSTSQAERKHISDTMKGISRFFLGSWYIMLAGAENGSRVLGFLDGEVFGDDGCP